MLMVILLSLAVPCIAVITYVASQRRLSTVAADIRGIALQTVIIIVVLIAIAGAIAGVLIARGGDAVADIERQQITRTAGDYTRQSLCKAAGFTWSGTALSGANCS